jgi:hypothetical protein
LSVFRKPAGRLAGKNKDADCDPCRDHATRQTIGHAQKAQSMVAAAEPNDPPTKIAVTNHVSSRLRASLSRPSTID